jgi:uncharacterized protein YqgQ
MKPQALTLLDVKQLLRGFGIVIYTGDAVGDYMLMEDELKELQEAGLLPIELYQACLLVIRKRIREIDIAPKDG